MATVTQYIEPDVSAIEQLNSLTLDGDYQHQAVCLRDIVVTHWNANLPQPYVSFNQGDELFVFLWVGVNREGHVMLQIDGEMMVGQIDFWSDTREAIDFIDLAEPSGWQVVISAVLGK